VSAFIIKDSGKLTLFFPLSFPPVSFVFPYLSSMRGEIKKKALHCTLPVAVVACLLAPLA
jgi:hypothetical protein